MAKKKIDLATATVTFDFTKDGGEAIVFDGTKVPGYAPLSGVALQSYLHGFSQKIGDSYANANKQANPLAWAMGQVKELVAAITGGVWNAGRTGEGTIRVSLLARALHRIKLAAGDTTSTEEAAQAFVDSLSLDKEGNKTKESEAAGKLAVAEYKTKKKVAKMLDTIRLEDLQAKLVRAQSKATASAGLSDEEDEE